MEHEKPSLSEKEKLWSYGMEERAGRNAEIHIHLARTSHIHLLETVINGK